MKRIVFAVLCTVVIAFPTVLTAQQEGTDSAFAYVTYFECDPARESRADEIIERSFAPHYNAAVEGGDILSWSWLGHFVGGKYRRVLVLTASNIDDILAAAGALGEAIEENTPEAGRVFTDVCPVHEDYIWETVPGVGDAAVGAQRGEAGFSIYLDCDVNREDQVDELVRDTIGPFYDGYVESGGLTTWTWLKHNVGGQWRRLMSMTAVDHNRMLKTRKALEGDFASGRAKRALTELNEICPDHVDYMWDVLIEVP